MRSRRDFVDLEFPGELLQIKVKPRKVKVLRFTEPARCGLPAKRPNSISRFSPSEATAQTL